MNNISIAKETLKIINEKKYCLKEKEIRLPEMDYSSVQVYTPESGEKLQKNRMEPVKFNDFKITVTSEDSFQAASAFDNAAVMNFANAHHPGGGFMLGANAQEESLCRCSTLIASITSDKAAEMYRYNNLHINDVESDYMLYSKVCVFRNEKYELLSEPFTAGVLTVPAPNRNGFAVLTSLKRIDETMMRRIRIMLLIAAKNGHESVVLGAWGCGAFRNNPSRVAECFRKVLIDECYAAYFKNICFAIFGRADSRNITAFKECFKEKIQHLPLG